MLRHQPKVFSAASSFFDLPDWLVHKVFRTSSSPKCDALTLGNWVQPSISLLSGLQVELQSRKQRC